jgi:xanthine dehydrogenase YagS FAD-binding subunit
MRPFKYVRASDAAAAARAVAANPRAKFLAGGTNILDLMKEDVERPNELVDLTRLKLAEIKAAGGGISIGALAKNSDTANHPLIRRDYPLLTQAIVAGASGQLRNMATNGGNLMQRTRCQYFYDTAMPCNKREPGTGCGALEGLNRIHAIFGWSEKCVATYPGDMANALYALDAVVRVRGADGRERTIPVTDFHRLPGDTPQQDTNLAHGELITAIELPKSNFAKNYYYLKVATAPRTPSRSSPSPPRSSSTAAASSRRALCSALWRTSRGEVREAEAALSGGPRRRGASGGRPRRRSRARSRWRTTPIRSSSGSAQSCAP